MMNEVPTILMLIIVVSVVVKFWSNWRSNQYRCIRQRSTRPSGVLLIKISKLWRGKICPLNGYPYPS
jgi:hypothetical protein